MTRPSLLIVITTLLGALICEAHEVRPAYLDISENRPGEFSVLWKTPMAGNMRLMLDPVFSGPIGVLTPVAGRKSGDAAIQTWRLRSDALRGQTLRIAGLEATVTDTLVRITFADGSSWTRRLTPQSPEAAIPARPDAWSVAGTYLGLGVEHILAGVDHLLFVLALLLLTPGTMALVKTVTAFTIAHSITLGLATLGIVHVPSRPIEALIALSIVFVAAEIVRCSSRERAGLAARMPWLVAFIFGLLHGFGFAGALSEVGLPERQIPVALLFFNVGVEAGQLLFVAAVLALATAARRIWLHPLRWAPPALSYVIGSVAMFWTIQRITAF